MALVFWCLLVVHTDCRSSAKFLCSLKSLWRMVLVIYKTYNAGMRHRSIMCLCLHNLLRWHNVNLPRGSTSLIPRPTVGSYFESVQIPIIYTSFQFYPYISSVFHVTAFHPQNFSIFFLSSPCKLHVQPSQPPLILLDKLYKLITRVLFSLIAFIPYFYPYYFINASVCWKLI